MKVKTEFVWLVVKRHPMQIIKFYGGLKMKSFKATRTTKICSVILTVAILLSSMCITTFAVGTDDSRRSSVISSTLSQMMNKDSNDTYRVIIWLDEIDTEAAVKNATMKIPNYNETIKRLSESKKTSREEADEWTYCISIKRDAIKSCIQPYTNAFSNTYFTDSEHIYSSSYIPVIIADLSYNRIKEISTKEEVASIDFYYDDIVVDESVNKASITESIPIDYYSIPSNIEYIHADIFESDWGTRGYGVNVGILDTGNPDLTNSYFYGGNITVHYPSAVVQDHSTNVLKIAYRTACDANYYCTTYWNTNSSTTANLVSELDWFISKNVDVINMSLIVGSSQGGITDTNNTYGSNAKILDNFSYHFDFTIIIAAGNVGSSGITSGGMAYNVITVGNYHRYSDYIYIESSYNNISNTTLAYKPDICAPGLVFFDDLTYSCGTSNAAPFVTGVTTLLMACSGSFRVNPAQVKAVLTASVSMDNNWHNVPTSTYYRQFGAGLIDAGRASDIAMNMDYSDSIMAANASYAEYNITLSAYTVTRISLAFEKYVMDGLVDYSLANLDLQIYNSNGQLLYSSATSNNNVEIIEFNPSSSDIYTIRVVNTSPATYLSYTFNTPYSISWIQG